MKIAMAGTGYVGLITGVCLAEKGHEVICIDKDKSKIEILQSGKAYFYEKDLEELMRKNRERIVYTTDYQTAFKDAEVIFVGVETPEKKDGSANLEYINSVVEQIAEAVTRDCVVVIKSTVPIGTNDKIEMLLKERNKNKVIIEVVSNPEFLSQGSAVYDTLYANRIVVGVESQYTESIMREVYKKFTSPLIITNRRSAEMIKYASNNFLALKISYINEIAKLCEIVGADIEDVSYGMGLDPRIGGGFLKAGIGYGGSCFPKDTKALHWLANMNNFELKTIKAAIEVNEQQKLILYKKAKKYYVDFKGLSIAILGLSFKPGTDDLREAPSVVNIQLLLEDGAKIRAYDPVVSSEKLKRTINWTGEQLQLFKTIDETILEADLCFIFTDWKDICDYDLKKFSNLMRTPIILDGRNCYGTKQIENLLYESIGREVKGELNKDEVNK